ncbi:response regulator [Caballeronia humi]|uniref:Response regulator receiver protein n=1 Tax=Caballeronia humi TaxID=326474 RepID=A0A158JGJ0_9BURK|nr:response regulator [Caballeronia humi]SAL67521.1 response regulator receiver protein [Caballeronia humi]
MTRDRYKILIVDDNDEMRQALSILLQVRDLQVLACASPSEAFEAATSWKPNAMVLDIDLPTKSGFDLYRELRAAGHAVPAVFITGNASDVGLDRAAEFNATVLQKPFASGVLFAALDKALSK